MPLITEEQIYNIFFAVNPDTLNQQTYADLDYAARLDLIYKTQMVNIQTGQWGKDAIEYALISHPYPKDPASDPIETAQKLEGLMDLIELELESEGAHDFTVVLIKDGENIGEGDYSLVWGADMISGKQSYRVICHQEEGQSIGLSKIIEEGVN
jgi:hypothetical protein